MVFGISQWTLNIEKTRDHNSLATSQCTNKWSTVLLLHLRMQHQSTKMIPLLIRLSHVKKFPHAAIHTKCLTQYFNWSLNLCSFSLNIVLAFAVLAIWTSWKDHGPKSMEYTPSMVIIAVAIVTLAVSAA
jgi:hypothetical protein